MSLTLTLTTEQAITLLEQLPPRKKMEVLIRLSEEAHVGLEGQMRYGESKVRQLCAKRGLNWLVGTVLTDALGYYQAVLKSVDTQRVYFVTLNEVQDGWRLVMVEPKRVVLEKGDRRITLGLNEQHLFISR